MKKSYQSAQSEALDFFIFFLVQPAVQFSDSLFLFRQSTSAFKTQENVFCFRSVWND